MTPRAGLAFRRIKASPLVAKAGPIRRPAFLLLVRVLSADERVVRLASAFRSRALENMTFPSTGRRLAAVASLAFFVGACASGGSAPKPASMEPLEANVEGGVPGEILDVRKLDGSNPPMLRYTVRLDSGESMTVDEPAGRNLSDHAKVYVVSRDGKPYLVKR